ncbi:MAG: DMT family transporter, partial [Planctomycetota bacterium]
MAQIALLFTCVIWGSTFFSQQIGVLAIGDNPLAACLFLALRFTTATLLMALVMPKCLKALDRRTVRDGIVMSIPFALGFATQLSGLRTTTPTLSAFITNLSVVLTPMLGVLFFREKVGRALLLGVVLSLAGLAILTDPFGGGIGPGEALTLACALLFSVYVHLIDIFTKRSSPQGLTFVVFVCTSLFMWATLAVMPDGRVLLAQLPAHLRNIDVVWPALYNAVFASVIAINLLHHFQRKVTPTRAAVIYVSEPVFAAVFAAVIVDEHMTAAKIAGGAVIVLGNLVCEAVGRARGRSPVAA